MGSWWQVQVGKHPAPIWGKNFVSDKLMLVFTDDDHFLDQKKLDDLREFDRLFVEDRTAAMEMEPSWHSGVMGYRATVRTLKARLSLQGFSTERVRSLCAAYFDDDLVFGPPETDADDDDWRRAHPSYSDGAAIAAGLASRRGQAAAAAFEPGLIDSQERFLHDQWQSLREGLDDPRLALALALTNTRDNTTVTLDLTDLVTGGWMDADDAPHRDARHRMAASVAAGGPVIVIAEGTSDARWLRRSLEIAAPETAHLFQFLDFAGYRAPGGTDRVVALTRGMAAAGVMNRILAVLDNDTAGREAAAQLADLSSDPRVAVITLPDIRYARSYPTLGPGGQSSADVNGRAAAIEFMFGEQVLRDEDGRLFPVRWQSYSQALAEYQGRLDNTHKTTVAQRIDQALRGPGPVDAEVLNGCRRLANALIRAAEPPKHLPASEFAEVSSEWRRSHI